ncbi:expressed unknown protein [Seminavis robusta]|uniref:Uncharacterized protein n=1 Tax=Seminavis robusta TaxID=568900 RepID=A0A9N8HHE3_9STRA|nr:expressed unknown protein [Seminavis robusta]|eukprot:Sro532_g161500.1 n/a (174) ;mRNA; r:34274-34795
MMRPVASLLLLLLAIGSVAVVTADLNVYGEPLKECSSDGMARTGFTRTGKCMDKDRDTGSHNVCIDLTSAQNGNFCTVTGQPNWCDEDKTCHDEDHSSSTNNCPIVNWCVCEWAFKGYIERAGGCDQVSEVECESTNQKVVLHYQTAIDNNDDAENAQAALDCLRAKCGQQIG